MSAKVFTNGHGQLAIDVTDLPTRPSFTQAEGVMAALASFTGDTWKVEKVSGRWFIYRSGELLGERRSASFDTALHNTGHLAVIRLISF